MIRVLWFLSGYFILKFSWESRKFTATHTQICSSSWNVLTCRPNDHLFTFQDGPQVPPTDMAISPRPQTCIPRLLEDHHHLPVTQAGNIRTNTNPSFSLCLRSLLSVSWNPAHCPHSPGLVCPLLDSGNRASSVHPPQGIRGHLLKRPGWDAHFRHWSSLRFLRAHVIKSIASLWYASPFPVSSLPSSFLVTALDTLYLSRPWPLLPPQPAALWPGLEAETRACWTPSSLPQAAPISAPAAPLPSLSPVLPIADGVRVGEA